MQRLFYALLFLLTVSACGDSKGPEIADLARIEQAASITAHTTRLPGHDPESQAIALTQAVYPATREENAAGAIILTRQDLAEAFTAMHRVTHMPVNAPLLYLSRDGTLSAATLREMKRIKPDGVVQDAKTQVYLVGKIDPSVAQTVEDELGYKTRRLYADNPVALAELLDRWQAALKSDHPDEVIISALDHPDGIAHGMGAMGWNAHMGKGFAWVYRDSIPDATRAILRRRFGNAGAFIYLTGGPDVISESVAVELSEYGLVRRIHGPDVYASNAVNAGYKDFGRDFGWWWGWSARAFGWGISQAGHNFIIASATDLLGAVPAVLLGHMGKHGPMLLIQPNAVPQVVADYLNMVKPFRSGPAETVLNHAWIIGDKSRISLNAQREIELLMRPDAPSEDRTELAAGERLRSGR